MVNARQNRPSFYWKPASNCKHRSIIVLPHCHAPRPLKERAGVGVQGSEGIAIYWPSRGLRLATHNHQAIAIAVLAGY